MYGRRALVIVRGFTKPAAGLVAERFDERGRNWLPVGVSGRVTTVQNCLFDGILAGGRGHDAFDVIAGGEGGGVPFASMIADRLHLLLPLAIIVALYRARQTDPDIMIRFNGVEAFTLGIAGLSTENIVEVGKRVDAKLAELDVEIPAGVDVLPIYQQHVVVEQALLLAVDVDAEVRVLGVQVDQCDAFDARGRPHPRPVSRSRVR